MTFIDNSELEPEIQTDKAATKEVACRLCQRRLIVTTFFAPAKARCGSCKKNWSDLAPPPMAGGAPEFTGPSAELRALADHTGLPVQVVAALQRGDDRGEIAIPDRRTVDAIGYNTRQINAIVAYQKLQRVA